MKQHPELVWTESERLSPAYDGSEFGAAGAYEWIFGRIAGSVNPKDARNAGIALIDRAPRDEKGNVRYEADYAILKPVDPQRGNGWLLYDVLNRGTKRAIQRINTGPATNRPLTLADLGTSYLLEHGFTLVWTAWQGDAPPGAGRMLAELPVATDEGRPIIGRTREEFILDVPAAIREDGIVEVSEETFQIRLSYPAAEVNDTASARLTIRQRERDERQQPHGLSWRYLDERTIEVAHAPSLPFDRGAIYEFVYNAKDPVVMGLGLAIIRDSVSFLRHAAVDEAGHPNPLHGHVRRTLGFGLSQSGRVLRDFLYEGFNADLQGRAVFDAVTPLIAGSRRSFLNAPFSQPGRFSRQHEDHTFPGDQFPFAYDMQYDPISDRTDSILCRAEEEGVLPKIMHLDTDSEFFSARSSLVVTDCSGRDVALPPHVRFYLAASVAHGDYPLPPEVASAQGNTLTYGTLIRALIDAIVAWVDEGREPPPSRYPTREAGTLFSLDAAASLFPKIPGAHFPIALNELRLRDHTFVPPREHGEYPIFVGSTDCDGNGAAGIAHPLVVAPLGTHTGWQIRRPGFAEGELFNVFGSFWPFALTRAERETGGDPRPSLEERYGSVQGWRESLQTALAPLVAQGFLLEEDVARLLEISEKGYPKAFNVI
jgi:hypothetical protein